MQLSVIIPCRNAAATITTQLDAFTRQQWSQPWELLLADNGSSDDTLAIAANYQQWLPRLRIVDASARLGSAYARNVAVQAATSGSIAFCDADDEVADGWVAAMGEALLDYDFVVSQIEDRKLNPFWTSELWKPSLEGPRTHLHFLPAASTWGIGVRRTLHNSIGGFDETMFRLSDIDYCWKAQLNGATLRFIPEAVVHYRYRTALRAIFRQARLDGEYQVRLYQRYRDLGMPWHHWKRGVLNWLFLLQKAGQLRDKNKRYLWMRQFGLQLGWLYGSFRYRLLAI